MNSGKTKLMIFRKLKEIQNLHFKINQNVISETATFPYIGITFNNKLNWANHCSILSGKFSKVIYNIKQLHSIYPGHILKMLYDRLVHSKLIYGLLLWGVGNKAKRKPYVLLQ